jgi:hypothetical protein
MAPTRSRATGSMLGDATAGCPLLSFLYVHLWDNTVQRGQAVGGDLEAISAAFNARVAYLGITYAELARRADVNVDTLYSLRDATHTPRPRTLARVSEALGWPADALEKVGQGEPPPNERTIEERLSDLETRLDQVMRLLADQERQR